jgi:DNA repair ATPase RecN
MFISSEEKLKIWNNISEILKKINAINADTLFLSGKLKTLESRLIKLEPVKKAQKQKTLAQIQKQKDKQREYNRRYAAKKQFEKLERQMAEKAERDQNATSISTASV